MNYLTTKLKRKNTIIIIISMFIYLQCEENKINIKTKIENKLHIIIIIFVIRHSYHHYKSEIETSPVIIIKLFYSK